MGRNEDRFQSKFIDLTRQGSGVHHYCAYCGKEMKTRQELDDWDYRTYHYCDCEDARKEEEIMDKIRELERQLPKEKYEAALQVTKIKR